MPLTKKGTKIKRAMQKKYGKERGERIFYAAENKGTLEGVAVNERKKKRRDGGASGGRR